MKTFFNVLYRRILYKIPLKLLLILLAVVSVFIACFSHAGLEVYTGSKTVNPGTNNFIYPSDYGNVDYLCFSNPNNCPGLFSVQLSYSYGSNGGNVPTNAANGIYGYICADSGYYFNVVPSNNICTIGILTIKGTDYTSLQCQTEYNLIPISSVDQSYCVNNNLCPASGGGDCPNVGVSNVFINDIFHPGAFNIIINIPEEIDWDYAYTNSGSNINIDIVGYNVDYTKVQDQIDIQNFKPSDEDLSNIVSQVLPLFVPGLAIILLLYFIFRFIKKIF